MRARAAPRPAVSIRGAGAELWGLFGASRSKPLAEGGRVLRVDHSRHPHARARRRFQIAVSFFSFSSATESTAPRSDGAGRADCAGGAAAAAELRRHRRWPPVPPPAVGALRVNHSRHPHARARGADSRSRFHFLVSAARPSRRRCGRTALAEPPPALPRRPSYAVTAAGRRCLRAAVGGSASTIFGNLTRARGARRRFQITVSFFSFSGATPAMPRLAALAADGAGGGAPSRPS